jgi:hypothetical protein
MIAYGSRDAHSARRTLGLKSGSYIDDIAVDVSAIRDHIADVNADAKADRPIRRLLTVIDGHLLLHLDCTAHRSINAVEDDEEGITSRVDDSAAMLFDRRVDEIAAKSSKPFKCSDIITANQAAITDHVGMDDGDQLPPS